MKSGAERVELLAHCQIKRASNTQAASPFRYFSSPPNTYGRMKNPTDPLCEHRNDTCNKALGTWRNGFGQLIASEIRRQRAARLPALVL